MVAEVLCCFGKQCGAINIGKRRQRIFRRPLSFEWITAFNYFAVEIAGFARGAANALELIKTGFQLLIADAEILYGHVGGNKALSITLRYVASEAQLLGRNAPMLAIPMHPSATDTIAGQK